MEQFSCCSIFFFHSSFLLFSYEVESFPPRSHSPVVSGLQQCCCDGASHVLRLCCLQEGSCRWRMTWSYHSSCCFVHWSCSSSAALQTFFSLFTVSITLTYCLSVLFSAVENVNHNYNFRDVCVISRFLVHGSYSFSNIFNVFVSESSISKVQSPPTRTSRRNQSKAKSRPPEPEMDVQLLETLCKENECNTEEVRVSSYKHTSAAPMCFCAHSSFIPFITCR